MTLKGFEEFSFWHRKQIQSLYDSFLLKIFNELVSNELRVVAVVECTGTGEKIDVESLRKWPSAIYGH